MERCRNWYGNWRGISAFICVWMSETNKERTFLSAFYQIGLVKELGNVCEKPRLVKPNE